MAIEIWESKTWDTRLFSCRLLYSGGLPLLLQKSDTFLRTSTGGLEYFQNKDKMTKFYPCLILVLTGRMVRAGKWVGCNFDHSIQLNKET